ncbi:Integrase core domain protein [marine gamma proteobacterium HTCC2148]|jgi:IS30 family transposase|nr:Integrase core domain protein [marine gamma proteobacterium HTCC2148]EEB79398.1 Integrase core domain protein [marine gamma proteobacterium HTCC2148]
MPRKTRLHYTDEMKSYIWDRYKAGDSVWSIARSFDRSSSSIHGYLSRTGGIRPPERKRTNRCLSLSDREEISRGIVAGLSIRTIASDLGRAPSTISREIDRNGGLEGYRASQADQNAWDRAKRPKSCKLVLNRPLCRRVEAKLKRKWSPQQIAGWLKLEYAEDDRNQVSHETIYQSLFIQARGAFKKEFQEYLRSKRHIRRSRTSTLKDDGLGGIPDAVSIRERPAAVEDRAVPGHWEGDLIEGSNKTCIATLVERHSRYVLLAKIDKKDTETVINALIKQAKKLPRELYKSLTWDRGTEMTGHKRFTLETDIQVYFCDPKSPWQRGSNENTNRLLREYLPKYTDLSVYSQSELNWIARELNERPRKTLDYETPAARFNACVAATG